METTYLEQCPTCKVYSTGDCGCVEKPEKKTAKKEEKVETSIVVEPSLLSLLTGKS